MNAPAEFAVLITSFNYRHFIGEAIDSALNQSRPPARIVIVDDGSTDGTVEYVRQHYSGDVRVSIMEQTNAGQLAAFMTGVRAIASTQVIAFMDADDRWCREYLERLATVYQNRPSVSFVYGNMRYIGSRRGLYHRRTRSGDDGLSVLVGSFEGGWRSSATSAVSMRHPMAARILDLPAAFIPEWRSCADVCLGIGSDILGARKYYVGEALVEYRVHDSNVFIGRDRSSGFAESHRDRVQSLLKHYRVAAGIEELPRSHQCRRAFDELKTKSELARSDLTRYLRLVASSDLSAPGKALTYIRMWLQYLSLKLPRIGDAPPSNEESIIDDYEESPSRHL